jgi:short-subunit dehydrogenase
MRSKRTFRLALITGANSGLGEELARQLQKRGTPLLLSGRRACGSDWIECDLTATIEPLRLAIRERAPDLLINNAGYALYGHCLENPAEQSDILAVNALAPIELTLEAAAALRDRGLPGTILNVCSAAALFTIPALAAYAAAKACLASFSQSFDEEMRPHGIRILAALPGQIATPFAAKAAKKPALAASPLAMSKERAARLILRQIDRQLPYSLIDWRTRLLAAASSLVPSRWVARMLGREITCRTTRPA